MSVVQSQNLKLFFASDFLERGNNIVYGNIVFVNIVFVLTLWWLIDGDIVNGNIVFNIVKEA